MARHKLTPEKVRNAKPKEKPYRLRSDGEGLSLLVAVSGTKSWQFRYRHDGKEQVATLGRYPTMSLALARQEAEKARLKVSEGHHLTTEKRLERAKLAADNRATFASVSDDWIKREAKRLKWSPRHREQVRSSLKNHLSDLFKIPIKGINATLAGPILRRLEEASPTMCEKVKPRLFAVMDFALEQGLIPANPLPRSTRRAVAPVKHYPAVTDLEGVGAILRKARAADPCKGVARAHILGAFTAQRPEEVCEAKWEEFDLDQALWRIPRPRMKVKSEERPTHQVPIPPALLADLKRWKAEDGEGAEMVCPSPIKPGRAVTVEAWEKFYRRKLDLSGKHSPHSWRSVLKSVSKNAGESREAIEKQLDHKFGDKTEGAYDRADVLNLRRDLMQRHEDRLIAARDGAKVIQKKRRTKK